MSATGDRRRFAPAAARNRDPILDVLRGVLPPSGAVLEIASGSGEHALHFAEHLPGLVFQPSDPAPDSRASIDAWRTQQSPANLRPAADIDVERAGWEQPLAGEPWVALIAINMIHIAPWEACVGFWRGAGALLTPGTVGILYGPFRKAGHTAPSNADFDESLRARDPRWGVRDLEAVAAEAALNGFELEREVAMPANNTTVVFRRR